MRVVKSKVPKGKASLLAAQSDYFDCFCADFRSLKPITPNMALLQMFGRQSFSKWAIALLKLRHFFSSPLKKFPQNEFFVNNNITKIDIGHKIGPFTVEYLDGNEAIMVANTSFLKAYISLFVIHTDSEYELFFTTCNIYNNVFGRIYFFIIKPFHMIIVKSMMKRYVGNL